MYESRKPDNLLKGVSEGLTKFYRSIYLMSRKGQPNYEELRALLGIEDDVDDGLLKIPVAAPNLRKQSFSGGSRGSRSG